METKYISKDDLSLDTFMSVCLYVGLAKKSRQMVKNSQTEGFNIKLEIKDMIKVRLALNLFIHLSYHYDGR